MDRRSLLTSILGYIDLSDGAASPSFQRALSDYFQAAHNDQAGSAPPWSQLARDLNQRIDEADDSTSLDRAREVITFVHEELLLDYRRHHRDLLGHLSPEELITPFFLARCYEATLFNRSAGTARNEWSPRALDRLNDFIGHRPVAVLENHRGIQPYPHERVALIPVYLRGAGVAEGPFARLISRTIETLEQSDGDILESASMDPARMAELAIDPRAYDHAHPVNQRPGYQFGEWDPDRIDAQGHYHRFVLRRMILIALLAWLDQPHDDQEEAEIEAASVLAGTMLLASGISGWGPGAISGDMTLARLVPGIAAFRDRFYQMQLARIGGAHGERLRRQAQQMHQPFGAVRSFLNQHVASLRDQQIVRDRLSLLYARMGYSPASQRQAERIDVPATRLRSRLESQLSMAEHSLRAGRFRRTVEHLSEAEQVLHRAIECGAMIDPWNILGFHGHFPRYPAPEDAVNDSRVDTLLVSVQALFDGLAVALQEASAAGDTEHAAMLTEQLESLAGWWDQFATVEVSGIHRVSGQDAVQSARFVAEAMTDWRLAGQQAGDVAFWRNRIEHFRSTQSFGIVVGAMLDKEDAISSMALLMQWLSDYEQAPLDESGHSFHDLVVRWLALVHRFADRDEPIPTKPGARAADAGETVVKFLDYLEANAGPLWRVPSLAPPPSTRDDREDTFAAAYEGVTYRDQTDDGVEGDLAGDQPLPDLEGPFSEADAFMRRLRFIGTIARVLTLACHPSLIRRPIVAQRLPAWLEIAQRNQKDLQAFLASLEQLSITAPTGSRESLLQFERETSLKDALVAKTIYVTMETSRARRSLASATPGEDVADVGRTDWESQVVGLEAALRQGDADRAKEILPRFLDSLADAPLMYVPTDKGGKPTEVGAARDAREVVKSLAISLSVIADCRGTCDLLEAVLSQEHEQSARSSQMQVTEFDLLFRQAFRAVMNRLAGLLDEWPETKNDNERSTSVVGRVVSRFSNLWSRYIGNVRISELERRMTRTSWDRTCDFIQSFGQQLFSQGFMAEGNLRGIVHHGAEEYLAQLIADEDSDVIPETLRSAIERSDISLEDAADELDFIARSVLENYEVYRDYNTTTPQSDYGQNLYLLLELLRHKTEYKRHRWALEPAYIAHNVLVRQGRFESARLLRETLQKESQATAETILDELAESERQAGFRLQTIRSALSEGFAGPLRLDEILALAERSLDQDSGDAEADFASLESEIDDYVEGHTGSGVDVPDWLRQLEATVDNVLELRHGEHLDFDDLVRESYPNARISFAEYLAQIDDWDLPPRLALNAPDP